MTKMERKSEYNKLKKTLKDVWTTQMEMDEDANSDKMDVPSHYKKYTIQDRKIIVQQSMRELKELGTSYDDLKGVDPSICQHTIPLKSDAKPSRQHPYTYNETFARKIKKEIDKLKEAEFIYEIKHTDWVSPIVVVPKKNGKLRVCVDLKKVNAATIKNNYPLPITDHVIEQVAGREAYSFLNGFSGYNQLAKLEDQHKMAFATEWSIFAYRVMPVGLTSALATFQRLMSHGKILGHIVSKNGISTDMEKILVIVELPRPLRVKKVQAFMGHCGYYRRFIYLYAVIAKPLYALITKFEWTDECEKAFQNLKQ
ncbi:hypothetical protein L7F22_015472 [Adiantum nelumboides]|nr:hypothetical protein [Adiantum nelumboides]